VRFLFRLILLVFTAVLLWLGFATARRWHGDRALLERRLALATEENERLRALVVKQEKADLLSRTRTMRAEVEREVEMLRGLKFLHPVKYDAVSRKEIRSIFSNALAEENSEADFVNIGRAWARLGLLPKPMPLRQTLLDLLSEQVAAFYNHHEHKLFMFEDASLDKPYDRVLLAHELTHALQDQHFKLESLPISLRDNDDRATAALAVVEGDATAVMTDYMAQNVSLRVVLDTAASVMTQQMVQLQKTPRYLRERLVFPYVQGKVFCAAVLSGRGQAGVDECYRRVPSSTTQILHPDKYLSRHPEDPIAVTWPELKLQGRAPATGNVVGEAGIRSLLQEGSDEASAITAASGWRGDRYLSYEDDTLIWKTLWSDDLEAQQFFEAERAALTRRYGPALPESAEERLVVDTERGVRLVRLLPQNAVVLIDAPTAEIADVAEAQFAK
jgi:hypothetical protein